MDLDNGRLVAINVETKEDHQDIGLIDHAIYVQEFLGGLVKAIGMTPLTKPKVVQVPPSKYNIGDKHKDDGGLTVQIVISTSHIAYHSWPLQNRFRLVVDSCKDFSARDVLAFVHRFFHVKSYSIQDIAYERPSYSLETDYGSKEQTEATGRQEEAEGQA